MTLFGILSCSGSCLDSLLGLKVLGLSDWRDYLGCFCNCSDQDRVFPVLLIDACFRSKLVEMKMSRSCGSQHVGIGSSRFWKVSMAVEVAGENVWVNN